MLQMSKVVTPGMDREFLVVYRNQVAKRGKHEIVVSLKEVEVSCLHCTSGVTPHLSPQGCAYP